jgi:hypothetical protein
MKFQFLRFPRCGRADHHPHLAQDHPAKAFFIRDYEILSAQGELLTAATSAWLMMNMQTRRLYRLPPCMLNLPQNPDRQALAEPHEKLTPLADGEERLRCVPATHHRCGRARQ